MLKQKIGAKRRRPPRQKNGRSDESQKRMKFADSTSERIGSSAAAQTEETDIITSEQADSTMCQVEQCWQLRRPFLEIFDQDQYEDSRDAARVLLKWLIYPVECDKFLKYFMAFTNTSIFIISLMFSLGNCGKESRYCSNVIGHITITVYSVQLIWIEFSER